jgi:DNA-directed RNA polymerase subunit E'/Rpb7|tara:strand:- start:44 stop:532 length:489 start_codon:yes stop_codon:yes gene_type:complete
MSTLKNDLFIKTLINVKENIDPNDIKNKQDIDEKLLSKIIKRLGNKCSNYGYIERESIKLLDRSVAEIIGRHFNGKLSYNVKLEVNVCSPSKNDIVTCKVIAKNKIGILCQNDPLVIILSKDVHMKNVQFNAINENDIINVKILDYKYNYSDDQIQVVATLV